MRHLGLKTQMIKEDLEFLVNAGLFKQLDKPEEGIYVFKTTDRGRAALEQFYTLVTQFFTDSQDSKQMAVLFSLF